MSVRAAPTLTVLTVPSLDAVDMDMELVQQHHHHQQQQQQQQTLLSPLSDGERSPKSRNALGLTLPGTRTPPTTFAHSIDAMLGDAKQEDMEMRKQHQQHHHHHSPPRRIIHEVEQLNNNNKNTLIMTAPVICEQGPSAPASPTTQSPASRSAKRPCPLSVDALQRLNLLSPNYMPTNGTMDAGGARMPPISPSYPTSDLGSSPRSSISTSHYSALGINASNWHVFRDAYARRRSSGGVGAMSGSGDLDCESEASAKIGGGGGGGGFLTPHQMLSPAPFSPFSDYGVADLHCTSVYGTPYSNRSPNLSPSPVRRAGENLHFSFEQTRSRSSLSNPTGSGGQDSSGGECHLRIPQSRALDMEARVRSRSEGEALGGTIKCRTDVTSMVADDDQQQQEEQDERMDTGEEQQQQQQQQHPLLVATSSSSSSTPQLHAGQKRRLLHKSRRTDEDDFRPNAGDVLLPPADQRAKQLHALISQPDSSIGAMPRGDTLISRQPTIEEPPPSPTLAELFQPRDLDKQRRRQVEDWIRQQTAALEAFRHSLIPTHQEANLLQVPMLVPQNSLEHLWPNPSAFNSCAGPIRPAASLWRRSRSESDVSAATAAAAAAAKVNAENGTAAASGEGTLSSTASPAPAHRRTSQQHAAPLLKTPLNEATHVCEHCGQGFSMHDRLAKHIASRHRDRSASMNDENSRVHKCALCPKSFGRSDMLTRHMRLHTGIRPYACQLCGQVFSRSDHLSTHQRTHTGEKPYQCPLCNYSASRRDMITRHMRTHLMPDGTPVPFTAAELTEIPPISKLSLNSAPNACHGGGGSGAVTPHALATAEDTPPRLGTPVPPHTAPALAMMPSAREEPHAATARIVPSVPPPPPDPTPMAAFEPVQEQQRKHMEHMVAAAKLLSAAVTNGGQQQHHIGGFGTVHQAVQQQQQQQSQPARGPSLEGLLNPQMMLSTLHAQIPTHLRRSSPNLFGVHDYPSAFRPPPPIQLNALHHQQPSSAMSPAAVALSSALSSVQQLLQHQQQQQQQQQRLAAMSAAAAAAAVAAGGTAPFLFRQNSFGGLGFPGQQQQQQQKLDAAAAQPSHQLQQKPK